MAIFSNRNSSPQNPAPADAAADKSRAPAGLVPSAEDLRRRARHRLIGSAVLVVAAVILFPLVFDAEPRTVRLVYPGEADIEKGFVSVLTPVGAALIGLTAGQAIDWTDRDGRTRRLHVIEVSVEDIAAAS